VNVRGFRVDRILKNGIERPSDWCVLYDRLDLLRGLFIDFLSLNRGLLLLSSVELFSDLSAKIGHIATNDLLNLSVRCHEWIDVVTRFLRDKVNCLQILRIGHSQV